MIKLTATDGVAFYVLASAIHIIEPAPHDWKGKTLVEIEGNHRSVMETPEEVVLKIVRTLPV